MFFSFFRRPFSPAEREVVIARHPFSPLLPLPSSPDARKESKADIPSPFPLPPEYRPPPTAQKGSSSTLRFNLLSPAANKIDQSFSRCHFFFPPFAQRHRQVYDVTGTLQILSFLFPSSSEAGRNSVLSQGIFRLIDSSPPRGHRKWHCSPSLSYLSFSPGTRARPLLPYFSPQIFFYLSPT